LDSLYVNGEIGGGGSRWLRLPGAFRK